MDRCKHTTKNNKKLHVSLSSVSVLLTYKTGWILDFDLPGKRDCLSAAAVVLSLTCRMQCCIENVITSIIQQLL